MADPERMWYRIFKHILLSGNEPIFIAEVRGESHAVQAVDSLDARLSKEDKDAGWTHYRDKGTAMRQTTSPIKKKLAGGRRSAKSVRQNPRRR